MSGGFAGTGSVYTAGSQLQAFEDSLNLTLIANFTAVETLEADKWLYNRVALGSLGFGLHSTLLASLDQKIFGQHQ